MCRYIYVLIQGRLREGKKTSFVQKAYDTVWRNGLWVVGVRGKMWRVIKGFIGALDGECSEAFDV